MTLRNARHDRLSSTYRDDNDNVLDYESEVLSDDEYAWDWVVSETFARAFEIEFCVKLILLPKYRAGILGRCKGFADSSYAIELRPSLRGNEAWRTLFHELAHAITPADQPGHGDRFKASLIRTHEFWKKFVMGSTGDTKERLIKMVMNYGFWRGRPIGFSESIDQYGRTRTV